MPAKRKPKVKACTHKDLCLESSEHAQEVGYLQPTAEKRQAATQASGRVSKKTIPSPLPTASTFPPPLVLPDDELALDPKYPPQSLRSWSQMPAKNQPITRRSAIYVVPPPSVDASVTFLGAGARPSLPSGSRLAKGSKVAGSETPCEVASIEMEAVADYLRAFYHPLPVKVLDRRALTFVPWQDEPARTTNPHEPVPIALSTSTQAIRIRHRKSPDSLFNAQLNLNDVLDVALEILPSDAHSLIMLTHHDLYEDDEDDFCCGRAYGGSRVSVVSTARYHPVLDDLEGIDREHAWPASHCASFVAEQCGQAPKCKRSKLAQDDLGRSTSSGALHAALSSHSSLPSPTTPSALRALWLSRVCKTASHELGHCFGIDHCVYYASVMQGTSCLNEDARQPPYLCPVDLAKVLRATGSGERERYEALFRFSERWGEEERMFAAFAGWLRARLGNREIE